MEQHFGYVVVLFRGLRIVSSTLVPTLRHSIVMEAVEAMEATEATEAMSPRPLPLAQDQRHPTAPSRRDLHHVYSSSRGPSPWKSPFPPPWQRPEVVQNDLWVLAMPPPSYCKNEPEHPHCILPSHLSLTWFCYYSFMNLVILSVLLNEYYPNIFQYNIEENMVNSSSGSYSPNFFYFSLLIFNVKHAA